MKTLAINKRATYDYEILEKIEGGLVLAGYEVKSIKNGHMSLRGAYVTIKDEELFLINANISPYQPANIPESYDPTRSRKVLVHKRQIKSLIGKVSQKGLTLVPTRVYFKDRFIKLEFALGRGKRKMDKRENIKNRETKIAMQRTLRDKSL